MQSIQLPVTQVGLEQSIQAAMQKAGKSAQINLGTNSRQINALSQPLGRITGQADEFSKSMAAANARVLAFGASAGIFAVVAKSMNGLVASTIKVEKSLVAINSVLGVTSSELEKFGNKIFDVAKNTGQSFEVVAEGALELSRQGLGAEETLKRLNDSLILSRLSGIDAAKSVEGLTAAYNSFSSAGITTSEILNKLVVVSQKFAVSEKDLIEGLKRSASVANQAGVSMDELIGIITAVQEKTARGGAVIGNSFKTIFSSMQKKGVLSDLGDLGIKVVDLQGKILPATKILENLAKEFNSFSQLEQADIAEKLGNVYQLSNLLAAIQDLSSETSKYREAVDYAAKASNEAYTKNAAMNATLDAMINKVSLSAEQLGKTLGDIGLADNAKNLLSFFNGLLEGIQKVLGEESAMGDFVRGLVKGIGALVTGPGLALFGAIILKLSKDLVQFGFASLKSFFGIGKAAKEIQNLESSIQQILSRNVGLQQQLFQLEGDRVGQLKTITNALVQQEAILRKTSTTASTLAVGLYNVGGRASSAGIRINPQNAANSAGGYVPAVAKENKAIKAGVGGAKSGDKPVVIPNFNFGGGKKGTMVAHTGEYIVPNFQGKGSAVFNRDMVKSMGLPSGARKIGAAGGFIPNFADKAPRGPGSLEALNALDRLGIYPSSLEDLENTEKYGRYVSVSTGKGGAKSYVFNGKALGLGDDNIKVYESNLIKPFGTRSKNENQTIDAAKLFGSNLPPILTPNQEGLSQEFTPNYLGKKIKWQFPAYKLNVAGKENIINKFQKNFDKDSIKNFALKQAQKYAQSVVGLLDKDEPIQPDKIADFENARVQGFLSSVTGAFGGIFDAAVTVGVSAAAKESSAPAKKIGGNFDINMSKGSKSYEYIKTLFGGKEMGSIPRFNSKGDKIADRSSIRIADFKINANKTSTESMATKVMNTPYFQKTLAKEVGTSNAAGGYIPNFASMRSVGYLDGDVLSDPKYADIVKAQIEKLGIKGGVAEYHKYLGDLVSQARANNKIKKFTGIYGVPGAGKSTMMLGGSKAQISDNASLRKTNRIPILRPEDIDKVSEVIDTRASLVGTMRALEGGYLSNVDRMMILSSSAQEEQDEIKRRRNLRDSQIIAGNSNTSFGRSAGTSQGAMVDSGYIEAAALSILGPSKTAVLGIKSNFGLSRKRGSALPTVEEKKIGLAYGAFSPSTKGHAELLNMARAYGIPTEDFIAAVSREGGKVDAKDPHSWRTALFPQGFRKLLAQKTFAGANVIGADPNLFQGGIPSMFEVDPVNGQRRFIKAGAGSMAFVGSDKTEKDLEKYIKSGYQAIVGERTEGISGTSAREAIMGLNNEAIAKIFTKDAMSVIMEHLPQLKNRADIFPEILNRTSSKVDKKLLPIEAALAQLPSRITAKVDPATAEQILALREVRDKMKKLKEKYPSIMLKKLGKLFPSKYGLSSAAGGFIPNFAKVGDFIKSKYSIENSYKKGTQYTTDSGSTVKVSSDFKNKILNLDHIKSNKKGDAYSLFQHIVKLAKRSKSQIYSKSLEPQGDILNQFQGSQWEQLLKVYPQLRYRNQKNLLTSGRVVSEEDDFSAGLFDTSKIEMEFGSLDEFRKKVNGIDPIEFKKIFSRSKIADLQTKAFSGGYIPNFADVATRSGSSIKLDNGVLDVGYLSSSGGNPMFELARLFKERKVSKIKTGAVIGPKALPLLLKAKELIEKERAKDPSYPRIGIEGYFEPNQLRTKINSQSYKKGKLFGFEQYNKEDMKKLASFFSFAKVSSRDTKMTNLRDVFPSGFAGGYIPNFAGETPNRGVKNAAMQITKALGVGLIKQWIDSRLGDGFVDSIEATGLSKINPKNIAVFLEELAKPSRRKHERAFDMALMENPSMQAQFPKRYRALLAEAEEYKRVNGANGFLPNFANPLKDAVGREMAAGVPASQIYIDKNPKLKSAANPMGLMVANRRDEPAGGFQGINRAMREGRDPKTYGAAGGFVPNYAAEADKYKGMTRSDAIAQLEASLKPKIDESAKLYAENNKALKDSVEAIKIYKEKLENLQKTTSDADKTKKVYQNELKNLTNDFDKENKINIELNKEKQKLQQSQKDLNKQLQSEKAAITTASTSKKGKETLVGGGKAGSKALDGNRDMLGTIFALQSAMTALTGATADATSDFGQISNALAGGLSSFSTVSFAFTGLSQVMPKFASFLGPAGIAIGGLTAAYQIGTTLFNKYSGITSAVAISVEAMGKAAEGAAISLSTVGTARKEEIKKRAKEIGNSLGYGEVSTYKVSGNYDRAGTYTPGYSISSQKTAQFEGEILGELNQDLRNQYYSVIENALAQQVPEGIINKQIAKIKEDGIILDSELKSFSVAIADEMKKASVEVTKFLNSIGENASGVSDKIAGMSEQQFAELLDTGLIQDPQKRAEAAGYNNPEEYAKAGFAFKGSLQERIKTQLGIDPKIFEDRDDKQIGDILTKAKEQSSAALRQKNIDEPSQERSFNLNLGAIKAEAALNRKLDVQKAAIFDQELAQKGKLAEIENDISLSENDRLKALAAINMTHGQAIALLTEQEQKAKNIGDALINTLKAVPTIDADKISMLADQISTQLPKFDDTNIDEYKKKLEAVLTASDLNLQSEAVRPLINALVEAERTNKGITKEREKQLASLAAEYDIDIKKINLTSNQLSIEKQITAQIEARNSEASFAIENRVLNNAYETLSVNREIERVKRDTALNELQKAEEVYKLELKRRDLESTGIGIGLEQKLLNIDQELINKARTAIEGSKTIASSGLSSDLTIEQLQEIASKDFGVAENIKVAIANAGKQRDLARKEAENQKANLGDVVPDVLIDKVKEGFSGGIGSGIRGLQNQINTFAFDIGEKIPQMFSDNMSSAINKMIEGGESFGNVLQGAAYEFIKGINQANIQNLSDKASNWLFGSSKGESNVGSFFKNFFASGGKVTGGSGTKDDVPAMLMGGEYVINKRAVQKYGPQFLEALNSGSLGGFAAGGPVQKGPQGNFYTPGTFGTGSIEGKRNLLDFATQSGTSGKFDRMTNIDGYQSIALEPESSRLSMMGMRSSPAFEATQAAKQQAFDLYLQQYNQEQEAKKAEKEQKKALTRQLIMMAASAALGPIAKAGASGFAAAFKGADGQGLGSQLGAGFKGIFSGGNIGNQQVGGLSNLFSSAGKAFTGDFAGAGNQFRLSQIGSASQLNNLYKSNSEFASYINDMGGFDVSGAPRAISLARTSTVGITTSAKNYSRTLTNGDVNNIPDNWTPLPEGEGGINPILFPKNKATGGMIPPTSGIDTVPAMLSGGEFIMNRAAVQNIGVSKLQSMNTGASSASSDETAKDLNERLIAKLDELIQVSGSSGDININVSSSGETSQQDSGDTSDARQKLARQIRDSVMQVIQEEKRIGGSLRR
jgi:TP901 family phage tail tape measure protein